MQILLRSWRISLSLSIDLIHVLEFYKFRMDIFLSISHRTYVIRSVKLVSSQPLQWPPLKNIVRTTVCRKLVGIYINFDKYRDLCHASKLTIILHYTAWEGLNCGFWRFRNKLKLNTDAIILHKFYGNFIYKKLKAFSPKNVMDFRLFSTWVYVLLK